MDSFRYVPDRVRMFLENYPYEENSTCAFSRLGKPLSKCRVGLVCTAGLYVEGLEPPFDLEREKRNPAWGDPTYRRIPLGADRKAIRYAHRHYNHGGIKKDLNILFPVDRLIEFKSRGIIGEVAGENYSFMGYIPGIAEVKEKYGPEVARKLKEQGADIVLMVPS
jgi:D-proline reductase (dithiol) PrdB